jgi:hypothetical protein
MHVRYFLATPFILLGDAVDWIIEQITGMPVDKTIYYQEYVENPDYHVTIHEDYLDAFFDELERADTIEEMEDVMEKYQRLTIEKEEQQ